MGLGFIMHIIAKIAFVLVGYGIHMFLGKTLTPVEYGSIGVIMSIININYNFLSNGARQATSHLIACEKYNHKIIVKKGYKYQFMIAIILTFINLAGADLFATILNQPELAGYIRLTAFMLPFTAGYFISVGVCNGFKLLIVEALTVTIYPLVRLSIIPFVNSKIFCDSSTATIMGFFTAAVIGCVFGNTFVIKIMRKKTDACGVKISNSEFRRQIAEFLSFFVCVTILLNLDLLFVNAFVLNNNEVGYYTGASNFSKVSYYLLSAIYLIALPIVTGRYSKGDLTGCSDIIKKLFTIILGFILPIVTISGPICGNLMTVFYTEQYRIAGGETEILMFSQFLLGLFVIFNILICSVANKRFSTVLGWSVVLLDAFLCYLLVPEFSIMGAAVGSAISNFFGCFVSVIKLRNSFKDIWETRLTKILLANFFVFLIMSIVNCLWSSDNFILVMAVCMFVYTVFCSVLIYLKLIPLKILFKEFAKIS